MDKRFAPSVIAVTPIDVPGTPCPVMVPVNASIADPAAVLTKVRTHPPVTDCSLS
jgi:hypothetical protein